MLNNKSTVITFACIANINCSSPHRWLHLSTLNLHEWQGWEAPLSPNSIFFTSISFLLFLINPILCSCCLKRWCSCQEEAQWNVPFYIHNHTLFILYNPLNCFVQTINLKKALFRVQWGLSALTSFNCLALL